MDDKQRLIKLIELLPEKLVYTLTNEYLSNANYPKEWMEYFIAYEEHTEIILNEFSDKKINKAYKILNKSYYSLAEFLKKHFYTPTSHYKMYNGNPPFYYLEPRLHHNFALTEGNEKYSSSDAEKYDEYYNELQKLSGKFYEAYRNFIRVARAELEESKKIGHDKHKESNHVGIHIVIDKKNGIYLKKDPSKLYGAGGKRINLIWALKDGDKSGKFLAGLYYDKKMTNLSKAINGKKSTKGVNFHIKKSLNISHELIKNRKRGGYYINTDDFTIEWKE